MRRLTDTNLVFRALVILGLIGFGFYLANERGLIRIAFDADRSYISTVILAVYALASAHWLYLAKALSGERARLAALEQHLAHGQASDEEDGLVGGFLANLRTREAADEPAALVTAFGDALMNRHAFGHFVSDALIKLGLLGTIVGFILMLLPVSEIETFEPALDAATAGRHERRAWRWRSTPTLAGLVTSTLLKLQYHVLDASAAELATRLGVLADVHAAALRRTEDDAP